MYDEAEVVLVVAMVDVAKIMIFEQLSFCLIGSPVIKGTESGPGARARSPGLGPAGLRKYIRDN